MGKMPASVRRSALLALRACTVLAFGLFFLRRALLLPVQASRDYEAVQSRPFFVPAPIEKVCTYKNYIYILYADSGAVNVYDGEGTFLWAVSVPWHNHTADTQMTGRDGSLFLWQNRYDVYQYALETGAYQGSFPQAGHEAAFPMAFPPAERHPLAELPAGTVSYDALTVYRQTASGSVPVVARSGWVRLLFFVHIWALGFFSILLQILLEGPAGSWRKRRATPPVNPDAGGEQSCMKSGRQLSDGKEERRKEIQEGLLSGSTIRTCIHNRKCWMARDFSPAKANFRRNIGCISRKFNVGQQKKIRSASRLRL